MMILHFNADHYRDSFGEAAKAREAANAGWADAPHYQNGNGLSSLAANVLGIAGEIGACIAVNSALGQPAALPTLVKERVNGRYQGAGDFEIDGQAFEVRNTIDPDNTKVVVRQKDVKAGAILIATHAEYERTAKGGAIPNGTVHIIGWTTAAEGWEKGWPKYDYRLKGRLKPLSELREYLLAQGIGKDCSISVAPAMGYIHGV